VLTVTAVSEQGITSKQTRRVTVSR
jgi:hypothetical protein